MYAETLFIYGQMWPLRDRDEPVNPIEEGSLAAALLLNDAARLLRRQLFLFELR
jgi:hypothetical protein